MVYFILMRVDYLLIYKELIKELIKNCNAKQNRQWQQY